MIVYAEPSALVKLLVIQQNSEATRRVLSQAQALGTGLLIRAELGSAFARGLRRGLLSQEDAAEARRRLEAVWPTWIHVTVDQALVCLAEALAWEHGLRGYDAVHLASAQVWQEQMERTVTLATFGRELREAAKLARLRVWPT